jgi:hypothetical protein
MVTWSLHFLFFRYQEVSQAEQYHMLLYQYDSGSDYINHVQQSFGR